MPRRIPRQDAALLGMLESLESAIRANDHTGAQGIVRKALTPRMAAGTLAAELQTGIQRTGQVLNDFPTETWRALQYLETIRGSYYHVVNAPPPVPRSRPDFHDDPRKHGG
jgi:hypothetical protein